MKKISNTRFFLEYISILFITYLICNLFWAFLANVPYVESLRSRYNMYGLVFLYWWIPIFRMCDLENQNSINHKGLWGK